MTKKEIQEYSKGCKNNDDLRQHVRSKTTNGYDESFEGDLGIYHFNTFSVVICTSEIYFTQPYTGE